MYPSVKSFCVLSEIYCFSLQWGHFLPFLENPRVSTSLTSHLDLQLVQRIKAIFTFFCEHVL